MMKKKIKVGIERTGIFNKKFTGIGVYTNELIKGLKNRGIEVSSWVKISHKNKVKKNYKNIQFYYKSFYPLKNNVQIAHTCDSRFLDLKKAKKIITIHDLAIFKKANQIENYTTKNFKKKSIKKLKLFCRKADRIITVSQSTKNDFLELFNYDENKIDVIHLALRKLNLNENLNDFVLKKFNIKPKKFLLFVGAVSIRKNIIGFLRAFYLSKLYKDYKFVFAGPLSMGADIIKEEIEKMKLNDKIVITGYVDDNELDSLYNQAKAFVFATYYEGFGLPIIEAMNKRLPVLIGNRGAAPEVAGNYAVAVNPFSIDSISNGMKLIVQSDKERIKSAQQYAATFTLEKMINKTINSYKKLLY